jgi:CRP-like cAMP-binding protein
MLRTPVRLPHRQKVTGEGSRQILAVHLKGDLVDVQNSLLGIADHSVQALTSSRIATIPADAIVALIAAEPGVSLSLWLDTLIEASISREWLLSTGQRSARQRIAHFFCELAFREEDVQAPGGNRYALPLSQEEIGDATGMTAVHANRVIQGLRKDGIIEINGRVLIVIDWDALEVAGDFNSLYLHQNREQRVYRRRMAN